MLLFSNRPLPALTFQEKQACIALANQCLPDREHTSYLEERFGFYDEIWMAQDTDGLASFWLIQSFCEQNEQYVYLGPLYSKRGGFLSLFIHMFESLLSLLPNRPLHLMAELQNPELLLIFKTLFTRTSYPLLDDRAIPDSIRKTATLFAEKLPHIQQLHLDNLSTRGASTLYRPTKHSETVEAWLHARDIWLERGDSQVLLLSCPLDPCARQDVRNELQRGIVKLQEWAQYKTSMLQLFEEGLPHG